jgi:anti-anti-sigma regulatory factor
VSANIVFEKAGERAAVARFARPDVRAALYHFGHEHDDIGESTLYRELYEGAIAGLPEGGALVLNFGPIDLFSSAFYRLLLRARQDLKAKNARLLVCGFTRLANEAFNLMGGPRTFEVFATEADARAAAEA